MVLTIKEKDFRLYKQNELYHVILDSNSLIYYPVNDKRKNNTKTILIIDVIASACLNVGSKSNVCLSVYAYPISKWGKRRRVKKKILFEVLEGSYEEKLALAKEWRNAIYSEMSLKRNDLSWLMTENLIQQEKLSKILPMSISKKRKLLVFINPKSGHGLANEIFTNKVKPILDKAEVPCEVMLTDRANHAYDVIRTRDLDNYAGVFTVSGDGLVYEIYRALLHRDNWQEALSIPIGTIPGGSGNGLAKSHGFLLNEPYNSNPVLISTLNFLNPVSVPLDLALVHTKNSQSISFLSISFGFVADVDIESERLRSIGESRFTIWSLLRLITMRKYKARISFKRADATKLSSDPSNRGRPAFKSSQTLSEPAYEEGDEDTRERKVRSLIYDDDDENGDHSSMSSIKSDDEVVKVARSSWSVDNIIENSEETKATRSTEAIEAIKTANIDDIPIPDDVEVMEDEFTLIQSSMVPYISRTAHFSPKSTFTDGVMYLCIVKANVSKANALKFLIGIDTGAHLDVPGVICIPVTEYRLEPLCKTGKVTIDGELVEFGPVHVTLLPGKGRYITRLSPNLPQL